MKLSPTKVLNIISSQPLQKHYSRANFFRSLTLDEHWGKLKKSAMIKTQKTSVAFPGSSAYLTPGSASRIREGKYQDLGWKSCIIFLWAQKNFYGLTILKFLVRIRLDPGSGIFSAPGPGSGLEKFESRIKKSRIRNTEKTFHLLRYYCVCVWATPVELLYDSGGGPSVLDHVVEEFVAGRPLHGAVQATIALEVVHDHAVVAATHLLLHLAHHLPVHSLSVIFHINIYRQSVHNEAKQNLYCSLHTYKEQLALLHLEILYWSKFCPRNKWLPR